MLFENKADSSDSLGLFQAAEGLFRCVLMKEASVLNRSAAGEQTQLLLTLLLCLRMQTLEAADELGSALFMTGSWMRAALVRSWCLYFYFKLVRGCYASPKAQEFRLSELSHLDWVNF